MKKFGLALATIILCLAASGQALAQGSWSINPYAGVFMADDGGLKDAGADEGLDVSVDPAVLFGGRLGFVSAANWGFEAGYGYSPLKLTVGEGTDNFEVDATAQLFYGALNYIFPTASAAKIFLSAGAGGIHISGDEADFDADAKTSSTDLLANVGAGVMWQMNDRLAIRGDIKDHIEFCKAADTLDDFSACPLDDKALNHIEVSAGVAFLLGGGDGGM